MNNNQILAKGEYQLLKKELRGIQLEAGGLIMSLKTRLVTFENDVTRMDIPAMEASMDRLYALYKKASILKDRIRNIDIEIKSI